MVSTWRLVKHRQLVDLKKTGQKYQFTIHIDLCELRMRRNSTGLDRDTTRFSYISQKYGGNRVTLIWNHFIRKAKQVIRRQDFFLESTYSPTEVLRLWTEAQAVTMLSSFICSLLLHLMTSIMPDIACAQGKFPIL